MVCLTEMENDAAATEKPSVDDDDDDGKEDTAMMVKAAKLGNKVRRRMYSRFMSQMHNAKLRTQETVERLNFTVDLVINRFIMSVLDLRLLAATLIVLKIFIHHNMVDSV